MPGFHTRYTGMPGVNSYSMPGLANCDTGHKGALMPGVSSAERIGRSASETFSSWTMTITRLITDESLGLSSCLVR